MTHQEIMAELSKRATAGEELTEVEYTARYFAGKYYLQKAILQRWNALLELAVELVDGSTQQNKVIFDKKDPFTIVLEYPDGSKGTFRWSTDSKRWEIIYPS